MTLRRLTAAFRAPRAVGIGLLPALLLVATPAPASRDWVLVTGPASGSWYPLGALLVDLVNQAQPAIRLSQKPGNAVANLLQVGTGRAQLGFSSSQQTVQAVQGQADFAGKPLPALRNVATVALNYFTLIVTRESGIRRVEDLKGRRYVPMPRGNSAEVLARPLLRMHGLGYADLANVQFVGADDGVALVKDGHADAISALTVVPLASFTDLANVRDTRVIGLARDKIQALLAETPGLEPLTIRAGAYRGQEEPVQTVGNFVHLVTSAAVPDDDVYEITRILADNVKRLAQVHSTYADLDLALLAKKGPIPFHPGAERYYRQRGAL